MGALARIGLIWIFPITKLNQQPPFQHVLIDATNNIHMGPFSAESNKTLKNIHIMPKMVKHTLKILQHLLQDF